MPQTETFNVQMPTILAERIRSRVQAGEFASESEAIVHDLLEADRWNCLPHEAIGESLEEMLDGIPEQLARIDSGEEPTFTMDEVREHLSAHRAAFLKG